MFYNRKGIQKTIINERKEQERLDSLTLNEWMTPGLHRTITNAAAEARHDMTLSCPRVFSNTTVQKHQSFGAQDSLQSNSHIHT